VTVPFLDLGRLHESIQPELDEAFHATLASSGFVGGAAIAEFEAAFAAAHEAPAGAGCGSGTDALALALRALRLAPGDEVVIPAMTFVATAEAVVHAGATPVIADVDPLTLLLSPKTVAAVHTERTRAVMPVHLYGHVVPFAHLEAWKADGLLVVEDAAQAHLATCDGRFVGTTTAAACFSFFPGKNLGALGDGGFVLSHDTAVIDEIRRLRDHGRATKYEHDEIGWCSRLDGVQAAFLSVKLRHLPEWTERRRRAASRYRDRLGDVLIPWDDGAVHHLLVVRVLAERRGPIVNALRADGISTGIHYPLALSQQPSCKQWTRPCPVAERAAGEVLSLPIDPLMSDADVDRVCDAFERAVRRG
jgi:dTDP-4-amino-4,6-dideoxygalactose transaminase